MERELKLPFPIQWHLCSNPAGFHNLVVNIVNVKLYGDYTKEHSMCQQNILGYYAFKLKFIEIK